MTPFQTYILNWYSRYGRHHLPWRQDFEPYRVMVSEIMLQQTQVDRVIPKFEAFLKIFPSIQHLAAAEQSDVIKNWQGLGYNRRGLNLHRAAQKIVSDFSGEIPSSSEELLSLPGIGPYTTSSIQAFAFNMPSTVIETNVRTIYIYHFFPRRNDVSDTELTPHIDRTRDDDNPRHWYSALMDYGAHLKKVLPNPSRRSKHHTTQSKFEGSTRQVRGEVLKLLALKDSADEAQVRSSIRGNKNKLSGVLKQLSEEGFITKNGDAYSLK